MIRIGNIELDSNVFLAPMSGVTDLPFRRLVKRYGAGLVISEMIASQSMIRHTRQSIQMCMQSLDIKPSSVQLAGCEPDVIAEAAKLNQDMGADIIDINMGCPAKKIVNGWSGSALMKDELLAAKIMEKTVKAVTLPVTLKMRTGWNDENRNAPKLAKIAEESGIQLLTVHGRTRTQMYSGTSDWSFIGHIKEQVKIPLIANGDIITEEDAETCLKVSGADGVMIGRGCYGKPWLLNQIDHYLKTGEKLPSPDVNELRQVLREHVEALLTFYGEHTGSRIARKHVAWYSKSLKNSSEFRAKVNMTKSGDELKELIEIYFDLVVI